MQSVLAGYYGCLWTKVLFADAFSKFKEQGIFNQSTREQFLYAVLEADGSRTPVKLLVEFRGTEPVVAALPRNAGLPAWERR